MDWIVLLLVAIGIAEDYRAHKGIPRNPHYEVTATLFTLVVVLLLILFFFKK